MYKVPVQETSKQPFVENAIFGEMKLILNTKLDLVVNSTFNANLVNYDQDYDANQSFSLEFKKHMIDVKLILKKFLPSNKKIVEVGCGKGDFLELIEKDNYFKIRVLTS
jgi:hypothetical protein|tara:strand:+ start:410 stop:736 length:327 start_codon:yes stop_codon:yes gene_type:complete